MKCLKSKLKNCKDAYRMVNSNYRRSAGGLELEKDQEKTCGGNVSQFLVDFDRRFMLVVAHIICTNCVQSNCVQSQQITYALNNPCQPAMLQVNHYAAYKYLFSC